MFKSATLNNFVWVAPIYALIYSSAHLGVRPIAATHSSTRPFTPSLSRRASVCAATPSRLWKAPTPFLSRSLREGLKSQGPRERYARRSRYALNALVSADLNFRSSPASTAASATDEKGIGMRVASYIWMNLLYSS